MSKKPRGGSRQAEMFPRSKRPTVPIEPNHRLVLLTDATDWTELEARAEEIRLSKVKNAAGRPPQMRTNLGAMMLKATRDMTWREAEDLIRHYAPARYLCGLTETEESPDFTTLHDFAVLMGEDGVKLINEYTVQWAVAEKLADPSVVVGDTTAQEAAVPYPNEMGLMAAFVTSLVAASKRAGSAVKQCVERAGKQLKAAREKVREYRLFAKTKELKDKMTAQMATQVEAINDRLGRTLAGISESRSRLSKYGIVASQKVTRLHATMKKLVPQIRYWLKTGFVATDKIISIHIPELYSVVRGKVGKKVEFGLTWGFTRLRGGFLLATVGKNRRELVDSKFVPKSVNDHIALFGKAPRAYAYDRAGHSEQNVKVLKELGVKEVGLAPRGRTQWEVNDKVRKQLVRERAMVEGGIGTVKSRRYGFNRPRARSTRMMGTYGQMAVLGFNLNKLVRGLAARNKMVVVA